MFDSSAAVLCWICPQGEPLSHVATTHLTFHLPDRLSVDKATLQTSLRQLLMMLSIMSPVLQVIKLPMDVIFLLSCEAIK